MALGPFLWGRGGAALTPEQVAREREIAQALIGQGVDTSPVGHWLQGAARMANSLAGNIREGRASRAETEGRSSASDAFKALGGSLSFPDAPVMGGQSPAVAGGGPAATVPEGERAEYIRAGLVNRGLPTHVADAFLMNFQDESGLDPAVNERAPLVPGSRGGFGLYQLTGPRRRAYEAFAQERGVNPGEIDPQLDFLMTELGGPEAAAAQSIMAAPDTPSAAAAIVNQFLRPAPQHRAAREARYRGAQTSAPAVSAVNAIADGDPMPQSPVTVAETPEEIVAAEAAMGDPAFAPIAQSLAAPPMGDPRAVQDMPVAGQPQQDMSRIPVMAGGNAGAMAPGAMPPVSMQQIMDVIGNQWSNPGERSVAQALLGQQMQQADPMRQLQMQKLQAEVGQLQSGMPSASSSFGNLDAQARAAGLVPGSREYQDFMLHGGGAPATFRALDMQAQAAGFQPGTPEYNEFMATRGAGLQAGAAQTAKNVADINTGGAAAGAIDLGKASVKAGTEAWSDYGKLQTSIGNMDEAIAAIDSGAQSGIIYKMLPNITEASASLQNAMDRMGLDVIGSVTFGALSEGEMRLAMQTAAPRDLSPPELRNWLVRKRDAQIKAADMLADAAQYLTKPGNTINGWIDRNREANKASQNRSSTGVQWSIEN